MRRKVLILKFLAAAVVAGALSAGAISAQEAARNEAMAFCRIQTDPQTAAMGYAGRASGGAWAAFRNVSATAFLPGTADVAASFQRWAPGLAAGPQGFAPDGSAAAQGSAAGGSASYQGSPAGGMLIPAIAGAARFGRIGLAVGYMASHSPYDPDLGFAPVDRAFGGGAAYALNGWLSAGAGLRVLSSGLLPDDSLHALAFDLSATALLGDFRLCAAVADLGQLVRESGRYGLPTSLALGGEWKASFGPGAAQGARHGNYRAASQRARDRSASQGARDEATLQGARGRSASQGARSRSASQGARGEAAGMGLHSIRLNADLDWFPVSGSLTAALGAEYGFQSRYFIRAGYHLAAGRTGAGGWTARGGSAVLPSFATLGAGLCLDHSALPFLGHTSLRLDLAWLIAHPVLGNTLQAGLGITW
ncbi:MAG: hypothetical protein II479_02620 [Bacteroidales bacterium]|nr:hypothetical protein [Bacteroidales bacterium]